MNSLRRLVLAGTRVFAASHSVRPDLWRGLGCLLMAGWVAVLAGGCGSTKPTPIAGEDRQPYTQVGIQPGDALKITFPAAPTMNTTQQVQSDGTIALPLGGSLEVRGKSPSEVEKVLLETYGAQLVVKEVAVSVESAGFVVYVSGAVLRPGPVRCRKSITVLEAVVEAGGFAEGRANLKNVKVVRQTDGGGTRTFVLDLNAALKGQESQPFYLRPSDVVYVPERFSFY